MLYQIGPSARTAVRKMAPADKIALFRQLFRGRDDVFARLWVNPKKQTKGYAPVCANEWVRGVCEKPRVKCGECPNQAFLKFDEQAVLAHLQGRHVIGAYLLLSDEILALPISWKGTLVQYTGRLHRPHPKKMEVRIYDYVDRDVPMLLKMFERRERAYRAIGYEED
jgi:hypothetical protein